MITKDKIQKAIEAAARKPKQRPAEPKRDCKDIIEKELGFCEQSR
jgi:hypothetical protein